MDVPLDLRSDETKAHHAAIAMAVVRERERCAEIAHNMARALAVQRRTNKMDRHAAETLVKCRDKILARAALTTTEGR